MFKTLFNFGTPPAPKARARDSQLSRPSDSRYDSGLDSTMGGNSQLRNSQFSDSKLNAKDGKNNDRAKDSTPGLERVDQRKRMALRPPSFTEMLPWSRFDPSEQIFVMKDGTTLGLMFEMSTVATEAQPMSYLRDRAHKVQESLQSLPESETSPWVVQFFLNDDLSMEGAKEKFENYISAVHSSSPKRGEEILNSQFTQAYIRELNKHLDSVSKPEGIFTDTLVTGQTWKGQIRRVRCCIYKRFQNLSAEYAEPIKQLEEVSITLMATLQEAGVRARRCNGKDLYEWMLPFFNPGIPWLHKIPYPGDQSPMADEDGEPRAPIFGWDLADSLNLSQPMSDVEAGLFEFNGKPYKCMTLQNLRAQPNIGHFTAERKSGKEFFARFDRLPPGAMLSMSIVIQPQDMIERHISRIRDTSRAKTAVAAETFGECENVLEAMARGDKLFPTMVNLYMMANTREELSSGISQVNAQLTPSGMRFIDPKHDLVPLDSFMRGLPMNFNPAFDTKFMRRSRLIFASDIAAMLPVYGRSHGTGNPNFWFWNRGGEPLTLDPLNKRDRKKNAHMLVLGPTGAGKSATLNYLTMSTMAVYRPRFVIADAGKSFQLLVEYMKTQGLKVHCVTLTSDADVSLPPFVHAYKLLDDNDVMGSFLAAERQVMSHSQGNKQTNSAADAGSGVAVDGDLLIKLSGDSKDLDLSPIKPLETFDEEDGSEDEENDKRDWLGEMLISALMMITGGEANEIARMGRADRYLVSRAIIKAAVQAKKLGQKHPLTQDVALQLTDMVRDQSLSPSRQARAEEMGQSMMTFTQALRGKLFNREGRDWPDADVTLVEMGTLTQDGYGDALALAYTSLIDSVQSRGEKAQAEDRPMIFLTDEGHLITTNDLLGPKIAKGTKMWRKLNIWFWLATQNLQDFPDSMSRVLSMCEYWMLLTMDKSEIAEVARFRTLTPEQRHLMESAKKEPSKYTEGVIINATDQMLFRNIPPALPIALAMTEGHEKAARRRLMEEHNITEMDAAIMIADQIGARRG